MTHPTTTYKVDGTSTTDGLIQLDPDHPQRRAVIPLDTVAWWDEHAEAGAIVLHLATGGSVFVQFTGHGAPEEWAKLADSLWSAKRREVQP